MSVLNPDNEIVERLIASIEADEARSIEQMPTEADALVVMFRAYERLKALGWREAIYCPKDGSTFDIVEAGSTGVHTAHYEGEWPKGSWWCHDAGDLWPSRPILWRPTPDDGGRDGR